MVAAVLSSGDQDTSHVGTLFMEFPCTLRTLYTIQQDVLDSKQINELISLMNKTFVKFFFSSALFSLNKIKH